MFKELFESQDPKDPKDTKDFITNIEVAFHKYFPNGYINIKEHTGFSSNIISGAIGMIGNINDTPHKIAQNDVMYHKFMMFHDKKTGTYKFEGSGRIYITPREGSYNAMDSIKTKMGNNSKITLQKVEVKMDKFFKKLSGLMKEHTDELYNVKDIKPKYLVFR